MSEKEVDDVLAEIADGLMDTCDHGVVFDEEEYHKHPNMTSYEVKTRWPRGFGLCPKGCGYYGIAYASYLHYIAGDW